MIVLLVIVVPVGRGWLQSRARQLAGDPATSTLMVASRFPRVRFPSAKPSQMQKVFERLEMVERRRNAVKAHADSAQAAFARVRNERSALEEKERQLTEQLAPTSLDPADRRRLNTELTTHINRLASIKIRETLAVDKNAEAAEALTEADRRWSRLRESLGQLERLLDGKPAGGK